APHVVRDLEPPHAERRPEGVPLERAGAFPEHPQGGAVVPVTLGAINLGLGLAATLVPEVVDLGKAIAALFQKHPTLTPEEFQDLVNGLAGDIHKTNADTLAELAKIPTA